MKIRILVVDDSKTLQAIIKRTLQNSNFEIVGCANDGQEGLELFKKLTPAVVLLDVTMPNMSGKECLAEIMAIAPQTMVIMISGLSDPNVEEDCLKYGARAFISKSEITNLDLFSKKIISTLEAFSTNEGNV